MLKVNPLKQISAKHLAFLNQPKILCGFAKDFKFNQKVSSENKIKKTVSRSRLFYTQDSLVTVLVKYLLEFS